MFFDVSYIDTLMYITTKYSEDVTICVKFNNLHLNNLDIEVFLYTAHNKDKFAAVLFAVLRNDIIRIHDFYSTVFNKGYGSAVFSAFLIVVAKIREQYPVRYIVGELVPKDYDYWEKSIHIYSNAIFYCDKYSTPLKLHSVVDRKYSFSEFLDIYPELKEKGAKFRIYLD